MGLGEKNGFSPNFCPEATIVWRSGGYGPKN